MQISITFDPAEASRAAVVLKAIEQVWSPSSDPPARRKPTVWPTANVVQLYNHVAAGLGAPSIEEAEPLPSPAENDSKEDILALVREHAREAGFKWVSENVLQVYGVRNLSECTEAQISEVLQKLRIPEAA